MPAGKIFAISFALNAALGAGFTSSMNQGVSKLQQLQSKTRDLSAEERRLTQQWKQSQAAVQAYQSKMAGLTERYTAGQMSQSQYKIAVASASATMQRASMSASAYRTALSGIQREAASASKSIANIQAVQSAQQRFSSAYAGMGNAVAGAGMVAAPLIGAVSTAMDFETAMSKVKAITGSNAEEMNKLNAQARELGRTTMFSASQAAEAMTYLGMAGWGTEQIMAGMPGLLDLAAASGSDLATVADIVSDDLTAFGMKAEQAGHMADVMAAASTNANTNVEMMGMTFKYAGAVAGALGYSLEDVSLATGLMANAGIKGEQAGTSLRAIMTRLISPPSDAAKSLDKLGISAKNADGTVKPFRQTMQELREKFAGLSDAEKAELASSIAGQEAMSGFLSVVNASNEDFAKLSNAVDNADGAAAKMAATMQDNAKGALTQMKSAVEGFAISIGNAFLPAVTAGAKGLADGASKATAWATEHTQVIQVLGGVAAGLASGAVVMKTFIAASAGISLINAKLVTYGINVMGAKTRTIQFIATMRNLTWSGVIGQAGAGIKNLGTVIADTSKSSLVWLRSLSAGSIISSATTALRGLGSAIMVISRASLAAALSPMGIAIMALAAAAYYCYTNWETVGPMFTGLWTTIQTALSSAWAMIQPALEGLYAAFDSISLAVSNNSGAFGMLFGTIVTVAQYVGGTVIGTFLMFAEIAVNAVATAINVIASIITGAIGVFSGLINFINAVFLGNWSAAWNAVLSIFSTVFNTIKNIASNILGGITNTISNIASSIGSITGLTGFGGAPVAHNAQGGIYNKGAFLTTFAEDGPEAAIPLDGSRRAIGLWQKAGEILGIGQGNSGSASAGSFSRGDSYDGSAPPITISLNFYGNADADSVRGAVEKAARSTQDSFAEQMARFRREERRLAYE